MDSRLGKTLRSVKRRRFYFKCEAFVVAQSPEVALEISDADAFHRFGQSDPWWAFGLSLNTLLVVLGRTNPHTFHAFQYCLVCFGGPFTIAFTLLFISTPARGPIYGQAYVSGFFLLVN
jgi:hypothetical protein